MAAIMRTIRYNIYYQRKAGISRAYKGAYFLFVMKFLKCALSSPFLKCTPNLFKYVCNVKLIHF